MYIFKKRYLFFLLFFYQKYILINYKNNKLNKKFISFIINSNTNIYFKFNNIVSYKSGSKHIFNNCRKEKIFFSTNFFFCNINIHGVGYKVIKDKSNILLFNIGFSSIVLYKVSSFIKIAIKNKNSTITLFSYNKQKLKQTIKEIQKLKIPDIYKGKGLIIQNQIIKTKVGKVR